MCVCVCVCVLPSILTFQVMLGFNTHTHIHTHARTPFITNQKLEGIYLNSCQHTNPLKEAGLKTLLKQKMYFILISDGVAYANTLVS